MNVLKNKRIFLMFKVIIVLIAFSFIAYAAYKIQQETGWWTAVIAFVVMTTWVFGVDSIIVIIKNYNRDERIAKRLYEELKTKDKES